MGHAGNTHVPAVQISVDAHAWPHIPQFALSVCASTQLVPHAIRPVGHTMPHVPAMHACPTMHARPQMPQLALSLCVSTQFPAQRVSPPVHGGNAQVPDWHVSPAAQACPHVPQFTASDVRLTHAAPQRVSPPPHGVATHEPRVHISKLMQPRPHPPQFAFDVCVSTHAPAHAVAPIVQLQLPPMHDAPPLHVPPAPPQHGSEGNPQVGPVSTMSLTSPPSVPSRATSPASAGLASRPGRCGSQFSTHPASELARSAITVSPFAGRIRTLRRRRGCSR
jgi:hypothetical protein